MMKLVLFLGLSLVMSVHALDNGMFRKPPMGWLSWERFRCNLDCKTYPDACINEKLYMSIADEIAKGGWIDAGYEWVNVDDCWADKQRDPTTGRMRGDPERFPSGMKALGDYIHSKGLKYGIYSDVGEKTCAGYPGSLGHYELDAQTFADWGVDSLKFDGCFLDTAEMDRAFPAMSRALKSTGRQIAYICVYGPYTKGDFNYEIAGQFCNQWRNYDDLQDDFDSFTHVVDWFAVNSSKAYPHAGPGAWNDGDMLVVGGYGLSLGLQKMQMALWSILAFPLLMGNDPRSISKEAKDILLNKEIIAVNQDVLGIPGYRAYFNQATRMEIWTRQLEGGDLAVAVVHRFSTEPYFPHPVPVEFDQIGWKNKNQDGVAYVRDLYLHENLGLLKTGFKVTVDPFGVRMLRLSAKPFPPVGATAATTVASSPEKAIDTVKPSASSWTFWSVLVVIGVLVAAVMLVNKMWRKKNGERASLLAL